MQLLQQKKVLIALGVILVVLLGGGAFFILGSHSSTQSQPSNLLNQQAVVPTLTPQSIGLTISIRDDKKAMKFTIANAKDIKNVEYTIAYTADQKGQQVEQGLIGEIAPDEGATSINTKYREFGTCSSGVCRYDTVVSPITLTLKITKTNGQVYQAVQTTTL